MIDTAAGQTRLWALQRRRLRRLLWLRRARNAVYADLVAIFHVDRPLELPAATYIGFAELLEHYGGAVAGIRHAANATSEDRSAEELLAARLMGNRTSTTARPRTAAPAAASDAHTAKMSTAMGIPHEAVSAPWSDRWTRLAALNGIPVPQEVTADG
jgi:hypothetical protein